MKKQISTTFLLILCFLQFSVIVYFGSDAIIDTVFSFRNSGNENENHRESVNVSVLQKKEFRGNIITYGKIKSLHNLVLKTPTFSNHKVVAGKIYFKPGEFVKKQQILVKFYCDDLVFKLQSLLKEMEHKKNFLEKVERTGSSSSDFEHKDAKLKYEKAKAEYDSLNASVASLSVYAPFDGIIGIPNIVEGEVIANEKDISQIVGTENLIAEFSVDIDQASHIALGNEIFISTLDNKTFIKGTVTGINPYIEESTSKIKIIAQLDENDNNKYFKHNLNIKIIADRQTIKDVFVIPRSAMIAIGDNNYVCKVEKTYAGYETRIIKINILDQRGELYAISSPSLIEGDYIVYEGVTKKDGVMVYLKEIVDL